MNLNVNFYFYGKHVVTTTTTPIQGVTVNTTSYDPSTLDWHDLENDSHFGGVRYRMCEGLEDKGKVKNIVTETYGDSDRVRSFVPTSVTRDATTIKFTFVFLGESRQADYQYLYDFFKGQRVVYWDTKRKRACVLLLTSQLKPLNDVYKGSTPYIQAEFEFSNLTGESVVCENKESAYYWAHDIMDLI